MAPNILVILSSHGPEDISEDQPFGWYLPELAHPFEVFTVGGARLTVASPKGGKTHVSRSSVEEYCNDKVCMEFYNAEKEVWDNTSRVRTYLGRSNEFDAIFIPGGVGPMFDLADHSPTQELIAEFYDNGKVVSAVCHGQAAFLQTRLRNGSPLLLEKNVTAFPESDEELTDLRRYFPFNLEARIRAINGDRFHTASEPLGEKVVVDGKLVTGQNPASAKRLAELILKMLA